MQNFVRKWAKRRVKGDDKGWQGRIQPKEATPKYGVPQTSMPVSDTRSNLGATLSFDGSPSDVINLEVLHLRSVSGAVLCYAIKVVCANCLM